MGESETGVAHLQLHIPYPIGVRALNRYARTLNLSETQVEALRGLYQEYAKDDAGFRSREIPPLRERSRVFAGSAGRFSSPGDADAYRKLKQDRDRAVKRLAAIEERFFASLWEFMTEDQAERMPRVRMQRTRSRYGLEPLHYPGSDIDLTLMVQDFFQEEDDLLLSDEETFNRLMLEYEVAITPLFRRRYQRVLKAETDAKLHLEAVFADLADKPAEVRMARAEQFAAERKRILSPPVRTAKRIHDINAHYVEVLSEYFCAPYQEAFAARFQEAAYPPLFPDAYNISSLFDEVLTAESLQPDQKDLLAAVGMTYREAHRSIDRAMVARYLEWKEKFAQTFTSNADESREYAEYMNGLQRSRASNARAYLQMLRSLLDTSQRTQLADRLQETATVLSGPVAPIRTSFAPPR